MNARNSATGIATPRIGAAERVGGMVDPQVHPGERQSEHERGGMTPHLARYRGRPGTKSPYANSISTTVSAATGRSAYPSHPHECGHAVRPGALSTDREQLHGDLDQREHDQD